jgi:hypothetical protein
MMKKLIIIKMKFIAHLSRKLKGKRLPNSILSLSRSLSFELVFSIRLVFDISFCQKGLEREKKVMI